MCQWSHRPYIVRNGDCSSFDVISRIIWIPISLMISFWMSGLVYTFSFLLSHSKRLVSSRAFIDNNWCKLLSDSSLFPLSSESLPTKEVNTSQNLIQTLSIGYLLCYILLRQEFTDIPSCGRQCDHYFRSFTVALFSCLRKAMVASFQLENPRVTYYVLILAI